MVFRNVHGLLGLAFHPNYPTDRRAWVAYTHETSPDVIVLRISEFETADGGATSNPASEQIVFEMAQPGGHNNGGHLLFGPDGYLYLGMGDGGNDDSNSAQAGNGQLTNNLFGKILRIDVSGMTGARRYKHSGRQSICRQRAVQHRRHRHDRLPGNLRLGIPQSLALDFRSSQRPAVAGRRGLAHARGSGPAWCSGGNYGWRCKEGTLDTSLMCGTPATPLVAPVAEYEHPTGQAVTGGFVYHGTAIPALVGRYVFADYSSQHHLAHRHRHGAHEVRDVTDGWDSGLNIASFAEDINGELYLVDVRTSGIYKLVAGS